MLFQAQSYTEPRRPTFPKGFDITEARSKREDHEVKLRTEIRQHLISKKRGSIEVFKHPSELPADLQSLMYQLTDDNLPSQERFEFLVELLLTNGQKELNSLELISKVLSADKTVVTEHIEKKLRKKLLTLLKSPQRNLKKEAAWCLANLTCINPSINVKLVREGAIESLSELISAEADVSDLAVITLTNLIGDCYFIRDFVIKSGVVEGVIGQIAKSTVISVEHLTNRLAFLACLIRVSPPPPVCLYLSIISQLSKLFKIPNDEVQLGTCLILMLIAKIDDYKSYASVYIHEVVGCLASENLDIQAYALGILGLISKKFPENVLANPEFFRELDKVFEKNETLLLQGALKILSNLLESSSASDKILGSTTVQRKILECLEHPDGRVVIEALYCTYNIACQDTPRSLFSLVSNGLLDRLSKLLTSKDVNIIRDVLCTVSSILDVAREYPVYQAYLDLLERNNCFQRLHALQTHPNSYFYEKTLAVLAAHFEVEEVSLQEFVFS